MKWFALVMVLFMSAFAYADDKADKTSLDGIIEKSGITKEEWDGTKREFFTEILGWIKSAKVQGAEIAGHTKDFLVEQVPLVINEIITWGIVKHSFFVISCFAGIMLFFLLSCFLFKKAKTVISSADREGVYMLSGISFIFSMISCGFMLYNIYYLCYVYFAPRLYLIDYISSLVKK